MGQDLQDILGVDAVTVVDVREAKIIMPARSMMYVADTGSAHFTWRAVAGRNIEAESLIGTAQFAGELIDQIKCALMVLESDGDGSMSFRAIYSTSFYCSTSLSPQ